MSASFPVTYSTLSPKALATDVLPDYGVGVVEADYLAGKEAGA